MSMIYHKALKKRMGTKSSKPKLSERRRSKTKMLERSQDSSSETEIADIMKNGIFKQKVEEFDLDFDRKSQIKCRLKYVETAVFGGEKETWDHIPKLGGVWWCVCHISWRKGTKHKGGN